ncbi:hypothetical protein F4778DRAFT_280574 [Xylariomycetidae sp. FL2044]|nr:hypothetical protein F4778DRAFT_280574 [Xylariomycetidae sp. FL2044]
MASSLKNTLISSLRPLNDILLGRNNNNNNSNPVVLNTSIGLFLLLGAATTATTYYLAYPSYAAWLALEPGAIPHNFLGYLMNLGMRAVVARSDTRAVPPPYATRDLRPVYGDAGERSFFSPLLPSSKEEEKEGSGLGLLERRKEPRPEVPAAVAPHRQTSEKASPEVVGRMNGFLEERVKRANEEEEGGIFAWKDSRLEGPTNKAIWVSGIGKKKEKMKKKMMTFGDLKKTGKGRLDGWWSSYDGYSHHNFLRPLSFSFSFVFLTFIRHTRLFLPSLTFTSHQLYPTPPPFRFPPPSPPCLYRTSLNHTQKLINQPPSKIKTDRRTKTKPPPALPEPRPGRDRPRPRRGVLAPDAEPGRRRDRRRARLGRAPPAQRRRRRPGPVLGLRPRLRAPRRGRARRVEGARHG